MLTPSFPITATERVLPSVAIDFTTAVADARVTTLRTGNTATRFNSVGAIELVNANTPRFNFNPVTLLCLGQLVEETRTNLFLNSLINGNPLSTQSVTLSAVPYTVSFYGTGSIAISGGHSATVSGAGAFPTRTTYTFTPSAGSSVFTVTGNVSYAQLEAGSFSTSFIPTAGTSVIRYSDEVKMTGVNFSSWWNANEGTLSLRQDNAASGYRTGLQVDDGTNNNRILIQSASPPTLQQYYVVSSGSAVVNTAAQSLISAGSCTVAAYKLNNYAYSVNGAISTVDTLATVPAVSQIFFGVERVANFLNGHIQKFMYWPQRLSNAEIRAFSNL